MLLWILLPSLLGLSAVTIGSYMQAKDSLDTQIAEELKQTVLSETSQLKSVTTDLLRNVLNNNARITAVHAYLKGGSESGGCPLFRIHAVVRENQAGRQGRGGIRPAYG